MTCPTCARDRCPSWPSGSARAPSLRDTTHYRSSGEDIDAVLIELQVHAATGTDRLAPQRMRNDPIARELVLTLTLPSSFSTIGDAALGAWPVTLRHRDQQVTGWRRQYQAAGVNTASSSRLASSRKSPYAR